jgi:CubicO group peptidase (beta-lactamase class C family)
MLSVSSTDFLIKTEVHEPASSEKRQVINDLWKEHAKIDDNSKSRPITVFAFPVADLATALEALHQSGQLQGVVVLSRGKEILYQKAAGSALTHSAASLSIDSQFYIGSVSKQFTAAALLKALYLQNGSLEHVKSALHLPISHYLSEGHPIWGEKMPKWAHQITLHELLTHTSGIVDFTNEEKFQEHLHRQKHTAQEIVAWIKDQELQFKPGTSLSYSNTNYLILAQIVSVCAKQPFEQFLSEQFFQPLSMTGTYHPTAGNLKEFQMSAPSLVGAESSDFDISHAQGCGGIISTVLDLLKWNIALHVDQAVLPWDVYALMVTDYTSKLPGSDEAEGYGIGIESHLFGKLYGYQGRLETFNSIIFFVPQEQVSVIMLTNTDQGHERVMQTIGNFLP